MLWFLANGSLNQYLKSQIQLQGNYYSGQKTALTKANFSPNTLTADFTNLHVENLPGFSQNFALIIDQATAQIASVNTVNVANLTVVNQLDIDNIKVNLEYQGDSNNIALILQKTVETLAKDFPLQYPEISAKNYAKQHPERDITLAKAPLITKESMVETKAAIEAKAAKKKSPQRKKINTKVIVKYINIKNLHITMIKQDRVNQKVFNNITLASIGGKDGLNSNQLGGELLKTLFERALKHVNSL